MKDLNAFDLKEATKIICGSAKIHGHRGKGLMKKCSKRFKKLLKVQKIKKLKQLKKLLKK